MSNPTAEMIASNAAGQATVPQASVNEADSCARGSLSIEQRSIERDAARYRALRRTTGHEMDISSSPGKPKVLVIHVDCEGCERWVSPGVIDYEATLDAALDDEIALQNA